MVFNSFHDIEFAAVMSTVWTCPFHQDSAVFAKAQVAYFTRSSAWSGVSPATPVLSQGSDPSGLWLSYNTTVAVTHSAINASRALVSETDGMSGPGPALYSFVRFRLIMPGFHRVGWYTQILYPKYSCSYRLFFNLKWLRTKDFPSISTLVICYEWFAAWLGLDLGAWFRSASSSEEIAIYTNVVTDSEWELSEDTCSEGNENFGLATEIRKVWVRNRIRKVWMGSQGQLRMRPFEVLRISNDADENLENCPKFCGLRKLDRCAT
ncbi:hypothetical protein LXL04_003886 [Taraxacum kok-saghyz]